MEWQRLALTAFTILALVSGNLLPAQPEQKKPPGKGSDRLEALASKLKLSDPQKQEVQQIYADFDKKAEPLIRQLCTQHHEQWQAMFKVLNEEQRAKLPEVVKAQVAKELQTIAQKLNLTEEQKQQVAKIRAEFWKKFQKLPAQKGENICREYRELCMDAFGAGREVLTPEQITKLPGIQRQEFNEGHDFTLRQDHLKAIGDQLRLSAEQRNQIQKLSASYEKKLELPRAQFKEVCKEKCAAMEKVLNADQRAKVQELFPFKCLETEQPAGEERKKE